MNTISFFTLILLLSLLFFEFKKEKRRNRILQSFIAGIIRSVSDYDSRLDIIEISSASGVNKTYAKTFPIQYNKLLQDIKMEFEKDFWVRPYWKWILKDRNLFYDKRYASDGFNMIYWDFFDNAISENQKQTDKEKNELPTTQ